MKMTTVKSQFRNAGILKLVSGYRHSREGIYHKSGGLTSLVQFWVSWTFVVFFSIWCLKSGWIYLNSRFIYKFYLKKTSTSNHFSTNRPGTAPIQHAIEFPYKKPGSINSRSFAHPRALRRQLQNPRTHNLNAGRFLVLFFWFWNVNSLSIRVFLCSSLNLTLLGRPRDKYSGCWHWRRRRATGGKVGGKKMLGARNNPDLYGPIVFRVGWWMFDLVFFLIFFEEFSFSSFQNTT